jgi:hypothetical protein
MGRIRFGLYLWVGLAIGCMGVAGLAASVGGKLSPDASAEIDVDLPGELHLRNKGGSDGAGLCVFTSISHSSRWQGIGLLEDFRDYMTQFPGGGYPDKVDRFIRKIAADKGLPVPSYVHVYGRDLAPLEEALKAGRMPCVTYCYSPSGRYGGGRISHMVNVVYLGPKYACILDNNFPGVAAYEWITRDEFLKTYTCGSSGWGIVFLDPGPPPLPHN